MLSFLKQLFAVIIGVFIAIFILGVVSVTALVAISSSEDTPMLSSNSVLRIKLDKPISEKEAENPWGDLDMNVPFLEIQNTIALRSVLRVIDHAKSDDKIKGIYLEGGSVMASFAMVEDIRTALLDFKRSGKFVYYYSDGFNESGTMLSTVADSVVMSPLGDMELNGLFVEQMYYKDFLEKIGVQAEVFRVGKYKSAVEPFMLSEMSQENRDQLAALLTSINDFNLSTMAKDRKKELAALHLISDSMLIRSPQDAVKYGMVQQIGYYDQMQEMFRRKLGLKADEKVSIINYDKYKKALKVEQKADKVAVLICEGEIQVGKSKQDVIGNVTVIEQLRKIAKDDEIKSVVIRINSPGGSALASDLMWNEIEQLKKKKPVVASMSSVAASGGYYMAMGCSKIFAQPNTITGSIGVFGLAFNPKQLLNDKLQIHSSAVSTGKFSNFMSLIDGFDAADRAIIQQQVEYTYNTFVSKAAEGRKMPVEKLQEVAQGRVWSGQQAKQLGLVDELGGLEAAIKGSAKLANMDSGTYEVVYYPKVESFYETILSDLSSEASSILMGRYLGEWGLYQQTVAELSAMKGVQARLPFKMELR